MQADFHHGLLGFKFHAVLVVSSAHMASMASPEGDRWLPIFWALDEFKDSQAIEQKETGWRMAPLDESTVPPPHRAKDAFIAAMESWDEERVEGAVVGLVRSAWAHEIYDLFYRFGSRDFRSIGHKAIFVANSWRTLQVIGWQHAEPVLRSLAFGLLQHDLPGTTPALSDDAADRPWRHSQELAAGMGAEWMSGRPDAGATREILAVLHNESNEDASNKAAELIRRGVSPQSVWDALFVGAGELLMRRPGVPALHAVTSTNALRHAFDACGDEHTRKRLLLQNCAFLPMFRESFGDRVADIGIDDVQPLTIAASSSSGAIEEIFSDMSEARMTAAKKIRRYVMDGGDVRDLMNAARRLIFSKGRNAHDYKFSGAVWEDYFNVSPEWRDRYLATSAFYLKGSGDPDNPLVERTRTALRS